MNGSSAGDSRARAARVAASLLTGGTPLLRAPIVRALAHPHVRWRRDDRMGAADAARRDRRRRRCSPRGRAARCLQGMLRNPLVDPYLTGVSAGAAAAIAIAVLSGIAAAFLPALGSARGWAHRRSRCGLARRGSGIDTNRLILAGVSFSTLFAAITTLAIVRSRVRTILARRGDTWRGWPVRWRDATGTT